MGVKRGVCLSTLLMGALIVTGGWMFWQTSTNCGDPAILSCRRATPQEEASWNNAYNSITWQPDAHCQQVQQWASNWGSHELWIITSTSDPLLDSYHQPLPTPPDVVYVHPNVPLSQQIEQIIHEMAHHAGIGDSPYEENMIKTVFEPCGRGFLW